jgi:sugar phosphate isomerase/epimerase
MTAIHEWTSAGNRKMNMTPAVGITTQIIRTAKWYKEVADLGFKTLEINRRNSKLHFSPYFLEKIKRYLDGYDLSLHSGASGIFQTTESFTQANLAVLTAEIDVCSILGAEQFVFHLNDGILSPENKKRLGEVIAYAGERGIQVLYESNSVLVAEDAFDILETFPELGYVLDLGHLNNGHGCGKLGCEISDFIGKIKDRVVYVHASNNSGLHDEHKGLDDGTLDWRSVLDLLNMSGIGKIILEVRDVGMVERSRRALYDYLWARHTPSHQAPVLENNSAAREIDTILD